jgi:transcriptional regulator with XRE-family HTH domain
MAAGAEPGRYAIKTLLAAGEQPFADLDDDELDSLGKAIGKGPLDDPVSVSEDGILLDGHQRLKAMLRSGRTWIQPSDVRIIEGVTRENALEKAVELNVRRRHLTVEQKAELVRRLQRERRWSQSKIAKLFGVSRPAVSQWLAKTADENADSDAEPHLIQGDDGKFYGREAVSNRRPTRPQRPPWHPDGYAFKGLAKARHLLRSEEYGGLPPLQEAKLSQLLADVIEAAEALQNVISDDEVSRAGEPD